MFMWRYLFKSFIIISCTIQITSFAEENATETPKWKFDEILDALIITNASNTNTVVMPKGWLERRSQAVAQLHALGTNALPLLIEELHYAASMEKTNAVEAINLKTRIAFAFKVLGPEADPLIPQLIIDLDSNRDPGNAAQALADIGEPAGGFALVEALTNPAPRVQISAATSLAFFKMDSDVANAAIPSLLWCLEVNSITLRSVSMNTLSTLRARPEIVLPALLKIAENDQEPILRAYAVQAIGRFGTNAISMESDLRELSDSDKNELVRRTAKRVLLSIRNNTSIP